jgi:hypothetical protein
MDFKMAKTIARNGIIESRLEKESADANIGQRS